MSIIVVEIDLAKNVFAVYGVKETGRSWSNFACQTTSRGLSLPVCRSASSGRASARGHTTGRRSPMRRGAASAWWHRGLWCRVG